MSEIKEIKDINPYGDRDNILQIDIDNPKDVYMLKRAIKSEGDYTFSIWHKSDSDSQITFNLFDISNETIDSTTEWQKYVKTVTIKEEELPIVNSDIKDFYKNVMESINGNEEVIVKNKEVLRVMRIMELIFESVRLKQVIHLENGI